MLFSAVSGIAVGVYFFFKNLVLRLKSLPDLLAGRRQRISAAVGKPYVVYSEGRQYWNVFGPVVEEFDRRGLPLMYYSSDPEDPGLKYTSKTVASALLGKGHAAFFTLNALEAEVCLTTTPGLDVYHWKRSPKVGCYVHILHAPNDATLYRLFGLDYYDAVLLNGEFHGSGIRELEVKRNLPPKTLITVGSTYLDVLKSRAEAVLADLPKEPGLTVLVSPSWGPNGLLRKFGMDLLGPLAATGLRVILRPHPQSRLSEAETLDQLKTALGGFFNVEWDFDRDNFRSLARASVMVSDFSGIIFDYIFLFSRPVLYSKTGFDLRPYDAEDLDGPTWTFETLPKIGRELDPLDFPRIGEAIQALSSNAETRAAIDQARVEAWSYPGESARRVVDALEDLRRR
jgi:hypothetical protein